MAKRVGVTVRYILGSLSSSEETKETLQKIVTFPGNSLSNMACLAAT